MNDYGGVVGFFDDDTDNRNVDFSHLVTSFLFDCFFDCNLNLADGVGNVVAVQNIQINIDIDGVVAFNVSVDVVVFDDTRLVGVFPRSSAPSISAAARDAMSAMISA